MSIMVQLMFANAGTYTAVEQEHVLSRLHASERLRYETFSSLRRRHTWLVGRTFLLDALQQQLGKVNAQSLRTDKHGGVRLLGEPFKLSLSHSRDMFVASLSHITTGVDVENLRPRKLLQHIGQVFTHSETDHMNDLKEAERLDAFYIYWTLKEAACKAANISIWESLRNTCFELRIGRFKSQAPFPTGDWHFMSAYIEPQWRVALAMRDAKSTPRVDCWRKIAAQEWYTQQVVRQVYLSGR
jgi:phosphopantetheinyl transferase